MIETRAKLKALAESVHGKLAQVDGLAPTEKAALKKGASKEFYTLTVNADRAAQLDLARIQFAPEDPKEAGAGISAVKKSAPTTPAAPQEQAPIADDETRTVRIEITIDE